MIMNYSDWWYMTGPVDPVEDVEPPVGAQGEEVVAGDGLRLSGLAHHEQLDKKHCISINYRIRFVQIRIRLLIKRRMTAGIPIPDQTIEGIPSQQCSWSGSEAEAKSVGMFLGLLDPDPSIKKISAV